MQHFVTLANPQTPVFLPSPSVLRLTRKERFKGKTIALLISNLNRPLIRVTISANSIDGIPTVEMVKIRMPKPKRVRGPSDRPFDEFPSVGHGAAEEPRP